MGSTIILPLEEEEERRRRKERKGDRGEMCLLTKGVALGGEVEVEVEVGRVSVCSASITFL